VVLWVCRFTRAWSARAFRDLSAQGCAAVGGRTIILPATNARTGTGVGNNSGTLNLENFDPGIRNAGSGDCMRRSSMSFSRERRHICAFDGIAPALR
jgi:hypothetical protein